MAGNIKGITIEFNGDTSKLDRSIREVDKSTRSIDSELRKVNNALKFNPTSVDLWRQKQTLLTQKISDTESRLKLLKQQQAQMDAKGVDKNSAEYRNLQREIITTQSKLKNFKGQLQAIGNVKLRAASEQLKAIGAKATAAGHATAGLSRAGAVLAGAIGALTVKAAKWADDLNTMQKKYHLNTKELQLYGAAAKLVDVDVGTIAKSHVKLKKSMTAAQRGSENQANAFKKLGISVTDADGNLRDSGEVWQEAITALGEVGNETDRDALAMDLFGKTASELNPLIEDGGETYKNVAETMKKYGLDFLDQSTLDKANEFNDKLDTIKAIGALAFQTLGAKLAEVLAPALEKVVEAGGQFANWFSNLNPVILAVIGGIGALVAVVSPALLLFGALSTAAGAVAGALAGISAPVIAVAAGIAALVAVFATAYKQSASFRSAVNGIVLIIGQTLKTVVTAAIKFFKELFNVLASTAKEVADDLAPILNALMPIFRLIATFLAGRLKNAFNMIITVVKLLSAGVKAVSSVFKTVFLAIGNIAANAYNRIKNVFSKVKDALAGPFEKAKSTISGIVDKIKGFFPIHFGRIFSGLKLPHFTVDGGKFPFGVAGKGKPPKWDVSWYAKGGIFNTPTIAGIGEAGPEAVVPLDKFWRKLEDMQTGGMVVNVYGSDNMSVNDLAEAVEQKIIQMQKRRRTAWQ